MNNKFREYLSLPYLFIKVFISNLLGKRKFIEETYNYGPDKKQNIIIIKPKGNERKDTIIFFSHGGGWRYGSANAFKFVGYFYASTGYTTIVADYRKVPKNTFPAQIEDTANAYILGIQILKEKEEYFNKVILVGHSAGAQLVASLAYGQSLEDLMIEKQLIKGVISMSGPINFAVCKNDYIAKTIKNFVVTDENWKKANPYLCLNDSTSIPILCIHGDCDPLVELTNSKSFVNKINEVRNGLGKLIIIKGGLHSNLVKIFLRKMKEHAVIEDWIETVSK